MSYASKYDELMQGVNAQFNDWVAQATSSAGSKVEDAQKEQRLKEEGFVSYITPDKQEIWIPAPKAPTSAIADYQKGFSSMSPETLKEQYPFLQYACDHFLPVIDELHDGVNDQSISLQYVQEMIIKLILEGVHEAIDNTGGMDAQGKSAVAKASSNAQAVATYAKNPDAVKQLAGGE